MSKRQYRFGKDYLTSRLERTNKFLRKFGLYAKLEKRER